MLAKTSTFASAAGVVTLTAIVLQVLIATRQTQVLSQQRAVFAGQQHLQRQQNRLNVLERAGHIWEKLAEGGGVARLFSDFPRVPPHAPRLVVPPEDREALAMAQRVYALRPFLARADSDGAEGEEPKALATMFAAARRQVNLMNELGELLEWELLELDLVLQKWHVAIIQRTWLLEPFICSENLTDKSRWGQRVLRLGQLARFYNDVSPLHRPNAVTIKARDHAPPFGTDHSGVIYDSELDAFGDAARLTRTANGAMALPAVFGDATTKAEQQRFLDRVESLFDDLEARYGPSA